MVYPVDYAPFRYNVLVAIHHDGGSVAVSHGGIECGQGINTKVSNCRFWSNFELGLYESLKYTGIASSC